MAGMGGSATEIDEGLIVRLLQEQAPQLASLPVVGERRVGQRRVAARRRARGAANATRGRG